MRVICLHKRIVEYKITKNNRIRQEPAQDTDRIAEIRGSYGDSNHEIILDEEKVLG